METPVKVSSATLLIANLKKVDYKKTTTLDKRARARPIDRSPDTRALNINKPTRGPIRTAPTPPTQTRHLHKSGYMGEWQGEGVG